MRALEASNPIQILMQMYYFRTAVKRLCFSDRKTASNFRTAIGYLSKFLMMQNCNFRYETNKGQENGSGLKDINYFKANYLERVVVFCYL